MQDGTHLTMLTVAGVQARFVDTLSFMPRSLAELPFDLGIGSIVKKGFFPYTFNVPEHETYVGPVPDKSFFGLSRMSIKKRSEFDAWYDTAVTEFKDQYNLMDQCEAYCINDVLVLRECCKITKTQFMTMFPGIDPFNQPTNPSAVMLGFQVHYLRPNTISVIPTSGYGNKHNQSNKALEWLATTEGETDARLQTCRSAAGEKYIGRLPVDGYDPENKIVYQFHGW